MPQLILVVDDEVSIADTLAELLAWEGHEVVTAGNGRAALDVIATQRPDVILCDFMMPIMDGAQLCREVKSKPELCGIPFILMTAAPQGLPKGVPFDRLLVKPFGADELRTILAAVRP